MVDSRFCFPFSSPVQCVQVSIPENDDLNMVFLALPSPADDREENDEEWMGKQKKIENYFMSEMIEIVSKDHVHHFLPKKFKGTPPSEIQSLMNEFLDEYEGEEPSTGLTVKISNPTSTSSRTLNTEWFTPVVTNRIRKSVRNRKGEKEGPPLEGYSICFINHNEEDWPVLMVLNSVATSASPFDDSSEDETPDFEKDHLTPLAFQLGEGIRTAKSVLQEMKFMEKRERRMRITADSISGRVRYLSYISMTVLLVVTYLQVTYLKRYFHKKKLL